jgi:2-oxoglutarate/2-oxoacid ferredoxin oxidoreductase subunit beta
MTSVLNRQRPPAFCAGCSHERVVHALDRALETLGLAGHQVALVSDIGCSGLFDTFFNTHALHGLHGRALTYATGLKLARPELTVVTTMGDGGLGIGGAHLLSACRRNLDITLLVLNNFNYGMTGGQCSATTPDDAQTASGFLNRLEPALDVCQVAAAAGAPYVARAMATWQDLPAAIERAMGYKGFSLLDIWGLCPGRYAKRNRLALRQMETRFKALPTADGPIAASQRPEYGSRYRECAAGQKPARDLPAVACEHQPPFEGRHEILLLGAAGQRINTAGEILCLAAMTAGLQATQKNDYPITVLRGHSVSEVVLCDSAVGYTGIHSPHAVLALAQEGVLRRKTVFSALAGDALVIAAPGIDVPRTRAKVDQVNFKAHGIPAAHWALAALARLASHGTIINRAMLDKALGYRYAGPALEEARSVIQRLEQSR